MKSRPEKGNAPEVAATEALSVKNQAIKQGFNMSNSTVVPANSQPVFNFGDNQVRLVVRDDGPWFVASDVCKALGYANTSKAIGDHLDEDEKGVTTGYTLGGDQKMVVINESGLYALVLRSRKSEARKFAKWVTREVLPAIRKTGEYQQPAAQTDPAIDYTRISPAQAQDLREIVQAIVDAKIQGHGETWARFQRKFKVNSYLQLPATHYEEARKYLIAKLPAGYEGEIVEESPLLNLSDPERLELAFTLSSQAGAQVSRSVFTAVMQNDQEWKTKRYVSNLTYDRMTSQLTCPSTKVMDHSEMITTLDKLPDWINGGDPIFATDEQLANIATACTQRLARSAASRRPSLGH